MARQEVGTEDYNRDLAALLAGIEAHVDTNLKLGDEFFYASLPLAVIDAIYSTGAKYTSARNVVTRWCALTGWDRFRGSSTTEHGLSELLDICEGKSFEVLANEVFDNRKPTSPKSGIPRSEAVVRFAQVLKQHEIERFADVQDVPRIEAAWREIKLIPGQASAKGAVSLTATCLRSVECPLPHLQPRP